MAEDSYSLRNRIIRAEQRLVRQREIVEELKRYNCANAAERLAELMEQTLKSMREEEKAQASAQSAKHDDAEQADHSERLAASDQ